MSTPIPPMSPAPVQPLVTPVPVVVVPSPSPLTQAERSLLDGPWLRIGLAVCISAALVAILYLVVMAVSGGNTLAKGWLEDGASHVASVATPLFVALSAYIVGWLRQSPVPKGL